ncbi:hypothetical protein HKX48_005281 [Thoreauomyces humboldtii]|nr:hypothetical protein HKX48_005281 [Thoreauomyces humboldtii]
MALFRFRQPPASASSSVKLVFLCVVCLVFLVTYRYILRTCAPRVPEQAPSMPTRPHSHLSSHVFTDSDLSRPVAHIDPDRINPETGLSAAVEAALEDPSSPVVSVHYGHPGPRRAKEWGVPSAPETLEKIISPSKDPNFYGVRYLTAPPKPSPPAPDPNSGPTQEELDAVAEMERKEALGSRLRKMAELTAKPRPPYVRTQPPEQYVAMCISVKNQHRDLAEWFKHHYHHLGIRKF